jgi:hypothetical protein
MSDFFFYKSLLTGWTNLLRRCSLASRDHINGRDREWAAARPDLLVVAPGNAVRAANFMGKSGSSVELTDCSPYSALRVYGGAVA